MPTMNGIDVPEQFTTSPFAIIFNTGYDQYAIKAIPFSAPGYLLKPEISDKRIDHYAFVSHEIKRYATGNWCLFYS